MGYKTELFSIYLPMYLLTHFIIMLEALPVPVAVNQQLKYLVYVGSAGKGSEGDEGHTQEGEWTLTSNPGGWTGGSLKEYKVRVWGGKRNWHL